MKEIYFIRHGETDWNKKKLGQGSRNDIPLNKEGEKQSKITGKYLNQYRQKDSKFDVILCSPLIRTKKTAEIIAKQINYKGNIIYFDELKERDHGLISIGKTNKELKKDDFYKDYFNFYKLYEKIKDPIDRILFYENNKKLESIEKKYELENDEHIIERVKIVLNFIEKSKYKKILVITHGGTIFNINRYLLNAYESPEGDFTNGLNCHITMYIYKDDKYKLVCPPNTLHFGLYKRLIKN
jgi:broad specificity phosphatase PhoE